MAAVEYLTAQGHEDHNQYITMLASGDDQADVQAMMAQASKDGFEDPIIITKWVSDSTGEVIHPDGKDMFRAHRRQWYLIAGTECDDDCDCSCDGVQMSFDMGEDC